ncbi:hypothetical protein ACFZAR_19855 [Streptomyces sp. NPDC008222]|uniref:hypothetical protein n=1 Tax=Streptomyces sp. NPDC008222 TaxID=3364820 RepID=UPI0036E9E1D0
MIRLEGDTASGRAYMQQLGRMHDGMSRVNHGLCHARDRRSPDGPTLAPLRAASPVTVA